jgi:UDP-N-acetylglucosamine/UDP-N-acetylgalactosamine diphosphorylase
MHQMTDRLSSIREILAAHGQEHVLRFADELDPAQREALLAQVEAIDMAWLDRLIDEHVRRPAESDGAVALEPAPYYPADPTGGPQPYDTAQYREIGREIIGQGKVAAFTVAGGQGTRLGWNGPKGTYPATVITGKPLFRCFAEQILAAQRKYGVTIPWFIMTSPLNDAETRAFFQDNNCFGLARTNIFMFPQGVVPSLERETGRLLLAERHRIAENPDGHGGSLRALRTSGSLEEMLAHGIEHISYFQVDNPLVKVIDPLFIGLHAAAPDSSGEMSSKMVAKASPQERVGVFCRRDGRTTVVEYSDLPAELAGQRDEQGQLRFNAGSIAVHLMSVTFVESVAGGDEASSLPFHRALKSVPHIDLETGRRIEPSEPNAVKLETFVFDALPRAASSIVLETERVEEFAPIKNAGGEDSPQTSHQLQSERAGRWLERHGVTVPRRTDGQVDARIEISPLTALESEDLVSARLPARVEPGEEVVV